MTMQNPWDRYGEGSGSTGDKPKRELESYSESELRQLWRAGRITESQWKQELVERGNSDQSAADKIASQKNVGVSTDAKTKGQLTASEQAAVNAFKSNAAPKGTDYDSWENPTLAAQGKSSIDPKYDSPNATGSGSSSGSSSAAAKAAPPPPIRDSLADLRNRGALDVGPAQVLEGQQYRKQNTVMQDEAGQYWITGPDGNPVGGPYPTQAEASRNNVYSNLGPAVTSNSYAAIGEMARLGANRPRISQGSGMDATTSLDQSISDTYSKGLQAGDWLGSTKNFGDNPVDILRGAIPDYGGMREVAGGGYTGRIMGDDGKEMAIGQSGITQSGTGYGSQMQSAFAPYLTDAQIAKIDPAKANDMLLKLQTLREQGTLVTPSSTTPAYRDGGYTWSEWLAAQEKAANAQNAALLGTDPYEVDVLPEVPAFKNGGSLMLHEPTMLVEGDGDVIGIAAEAGNAERVDMKPGGMKFTPTNKPARYHGGLMADALNVPTKGQFATGGQAEWEPPTPEQIALAESRNTQAAQYNAIQQQQAQSDRLALANGLPTAAERTAAMIARREAAEEAEQARKALEKAQQQEAANRLRQAEELRRRQAQDYKYGYAGLQAPIDVTAPDWDIDGLDRPTLKSAPTGTRWSVDSLMPGQRQSSITELVNDYLQAKNASSGIFGGGTSPWSSGTNRPPIGILPGERPEDQHADDAWGWGRGQSPLLRRALLRGDYNTLGRMLGMSPGQAQLRFGNKAPLGGGLQAVA